MPSHAVWSPVHRLVERAAAADPHAVAVRHGELSVSRGELVEQSRSLAAYLLARGIAPGSVVAVRLDRSIEHIVACLAILQAGCAFMSIDPSDPTDRAQRLVAHAGAAAVITDAARAPDHAGLSVGVGDTSGAAGALPDVSADDLAYVAHTSGSTGEPNAVEITHANLANLIAWAHETFAIGAEDRVTLALGLGFDAAIWELWPALAAGATVHVLDDIVRTSPELLRAYWLDERITLATAPTVLAEPMVAAQWPSDTRLRYVFTGGDVLRSRPREGLPFTLINNYGPTECTCEATWAVVQPAGAEAGLPPIGRPIAGVEVHILDEAQRPVRPGREGEIWIAGKSVGRGYRKNPELTAARFRPDPFSGERGARMYRTGDTGRVLPSGELAFCGRADRQVKIGGVRIEPDEVAAALQSHAEVATAIVTARDDGRGKMLVAYVVAEPGQAPDAAALRRHLADRLPRSYIPRAFVAIPAVPLTSNGKIDTAALPEPVRAASRPAAAEPASGPERKVLAIVREVLGDDAVMLDDNFFLLGGQSLQATEVVVRCRAAFGVQVALADLFAAESIGGFVAAIRERIERWVASLSDQDVATALGRR